MVKLTDTKAFMKEFERLCKYPVINEKAVIETVENYLSEGMQDYEMPSWQTKSGHAELIRAGIE